MTVPDRLFKMADDNSTDTVQSLLLLAFFALSVYKTADRYSIFNPPLNNTEPIISVAQCTPEISLPITINAEKANTNTSAALLVVTFETLLFTWNQSVGITESTSNVVDDG